MLKIGEFSKLSRVSIRMLRHYDEIGLLRPVKTDPESGYRYYGETQLPIVGRITSLKDMGFGLSAIAGILADYTDKDILERHLRLKQAELLELSEQTEQRLRLLDTALQRLRKDDSTMQYDVTIKTFPRRRAATVRMTIPHYEQEGMLWQILMQETAGMNLIPDSPCYACAMFHDREYKESDADVEVQRTVKGTYPDTEHVKFRTLPEVTAACATYKGPYEQIGEIMNAVLTWVVDNGYQFDGPAFNIYHVSPYETADANEFVTEVCYPVRKKQ